MKADLFPPLDEYESRVIGEVFELVTYSDYWREKELYRLAKIACALDAYALNKLSLDTGTNYHVPAIMKMMEKYATGIEKDIIFRRANAFANLYRLTEHSEDPHKNHCNYYALVCHVTKAGTRFVKVFAQHHYILYNVSYILSELGGIPFSRQRIALKFTGIRNNYVAVIRDLIDKERAYPCDWRISIQEIM